MDGFKAFKYYLAIKLHFTNPKYNVFERKGKLRGTRETFLTRNDHYLFEKIARRFDNDQQLIRYIASNFMYDNPNVVYNEAEAEENFVEYNRRRQSITKVFTDDVQRIVESGINTPNILQLYLGKKITIETAVILNDLENCISKLKDTESNTLLWGDEILRVEKSKGFVKYDSYKVVPVYMSMCEELKGKVNG